MNKVLIITTYFAPSRHIGAKRPIKFAKFLPEHGWQPLILTQEIGKYHGIDESLNDDFLDDLIVYRVKEWNLFRGKQEKRRMENTSKNIKIGLISFIARVVNYLSLYNYFWVFPAFFTAREIIRQHNINLIFTTSPSNEPHLVGLLLKLFTRKKWICDFRDPWKAPISIYPPRSVIHAKVNGAVERLVARKSDHIITVSKVLKEEIRELLDSRDGDKITVIYNGYDKDDFVYCCNRKQGKNGKFVITYSGTWGYFISPEFFLKALANLLSKRKDLRTKIRVNFIGEVKFDPELAVKINHIIQEENLSDVIDIVPFLPYRQALAKLAESDVLLLVIGILPDQQGYTKYRVPAKLFEYLYLQKPILALAPLNGEAAEIIGKTDAGEIVSPLDIEGIENKIFEMYKAFEEGKLVSGTKISEIEKYDRKKEISWLASIFNSVCEK